jgi:hypothetical protein
MGWTFLDTTDLPRLYDIVWCRFPEDGKSPGPKIRPSLVRGVKKDLESDRGALKVSYGTTNLKINTRSDFDLIIQFARSLQEIGLPSATRFDLDLSNVLPWCSEFFCPPPGWPSIIIGHLNEANIVRLEDRLRARGVIK